jgi:hypothetical protein
MIRARLARAAAAGPMFFVNAWLLMIFAGIVGGDVGIAPVGYVTSMVVTIGLWLVLAPAIGAVSQASTKTARKHGGYRRATSAGLLASLAQRD